MRKHFAKIRTFQDALSVIYLRFQERFLFYYGTALFLIKALFFGVKLKGRIKCWGKVDLGRAPGSEIVIGDEVNLVSHSNRCTASSIFSPVKLRTWTESSRIIIGNNVGLNGTSIVARSKTIYIGERTMIAPNVAIVDSDFHPLWPPENRRIFSGVKEDMDVSIGKDVWIGMQAIILKGAKIGDNSIIAAGSIVKGEIPPNVLAAGAPAQVIRDLDGEVR